MSSDKPLTFLLRPKKDIDKPRNQGGFFFLMRFTVVFILCLFLSINATKAWSATPISGEALPGLEVIDDVMLTLLKKYRFPGGSIAVAYKGKLILARSYGYAKKSLSEKIPLQPHHRFRLASLTKPVTATAIMRLIEEGRLSLDDKMILLLKDLAPKEVRDPRVNHITVRNLLEHRSGLGKERDMDAMLLRNPPCPGKLDYFLAKKLVFTPGEKFEYSNIGYCILGRIIEKVTGMAYGDYVKEYVLGPVGASDIELGASKELKTNEVNYYSGPRPPGVSGDFNMEANDADGGWIGSAVGYLKFLTSIDGQRHPPLLKTDTFKMMLARPDDPAIKGKNVYWAKGFRVLENPGGTCYFSYIGVVTGGAFAFAARDPSDWSWVALFNKITRNWGQDTIKIVIKLREAIISQEKPPEGDLFNKY